MASVPLLHPLSDFIRRDEIDGYDSEPAPRYWYEGRCPRRGEWFRLPRTALAETIARGLMQFLARDEQYSQEGKMYGVLLVKTPAGEQRVLKAFSGLLQGQATVDGWVPPIAGRDRVALQEAHTLAQLDRIKQELLFLKQVPERQQYQTLNQEFEQQLQQLVLSHQQRKQERQQKRQYFLEHLQENALSVALEQMDEQSRRDGMERRRLKHLREVQLRPLRQTIEQADSRMRELKQQRKALSRQLQAQMHAVYCLTNFAGESVSLQQLVAGGALPTGSGECCTPKLLHYAATHRLKPLAMAEFWWGAAPARGDKVQGEFYGACAERCQPLMGFLLSGLSQEISLPLIPGWGGEVGELSLSILYADEWLLAVNKPPGLLSVPGRYGDRQDSVLSRLRLLMPDSSCLTAVHRLDQDTSGVLLLARDLQTYRQLSQQFQQRQIHKVYEAIVSGSVAVDQGVIDLPLSSDLTDRPRQKVDWQRGKPSITRFRVIAQGTAQGIAEGVAPAAQYTRIEFIPLTGRTHQLRVHAADARGLGVPILGDRLYGCSASADRLHLHARELTFQHPQSREMLCLKAETLF